MEKKRLNWPDNLRTLATIAVILIHTSMYARPQYLILDILYEAWARIAVPTFILLSGALILSSSFELFSFLKKRIVRVIIPFLFWSLVYAVLKLPFYKDGFNFPNLLNSISWICESFYFKRISFHLWFVYMIVGLYLFIPIIIKWITNAQKTEVQYFLIIWVFTLLFNSPFNLIYFSEYLGYLVAGYYLITWPPKLPGWITLLAFLIFWLCTCVGTYLYSVKLHSFSGYFYNYLTINVMLMSVSVFIFFMNTKFKASGIFIKFRNFISKFSYGIYLIHILVLHSIERFGIKWDLITPSLGIPITVLGCLAVSGIIIWAINRIPVIGKYISG